MLYIWIQFENRFCDMYLPDTGKSSHTIPIRHLESGWDRDYYLSVRSLDGQCFITPPARFSWTGKQHGDSELPLQSGARYVLEAGSYRIAIVCSEAVQSDTVFRKYAMPADRPVRVGRNEECELSIAADHKLVSNLQGVFQLQKNGMLSYADKSKNGSFLNGMRFTDDFVQLTFGDIITLNSGIKFVCLGRYLAINRISTFHSISLDPVAAPQSAQTREYRDVPSVQVVFHRTPRFVQKQEAGEIHIEPPMDKQDQTDTPIWLAVGPSATMVFPMVMGSAIASSSGGFLGPGIAMVGTASVLAVFWGLLNYRFRKQRAEQTEETRVRKYRTYISQAEAYLQEQSQREYRRLLETKPNVRDCANFITEQRYRLWERMPSNDDFMEIRLGLGSVPLPDRILVDKLKLSLVDDSLRNEPFRLEEQYSYIPNAPVTVNLRKEPILGILGQDTARGLAQSILLQLAALHSYHDVRIVVISNSDEHSQWSWARWLPHVFASEDRQLRMVVSEPDAVQEVLAHLDDVLSMRNTGTTSLDAESSDDAPLPHYVVICTDPELLDNKPILKRILAGNMGMTLVIVASSIEELPKECRTVLDISNGESIMYVSGGSAMTVDFEYPNFALLQSFAKMIAPLRVKDSTESAAIPTLVPFLDLYGVQRVEDLDIWRFWNENHVYDGIRSQIGLGAGSKPFVLDISDKSHGPHGLLAGTTGSGKSVMLQTYILSLAVNYPPDQVRFILIDYKGGGMADTFRHLPHVAGIIDNLQSGNTIQRALASIQGEIQRREQLFKQADVSSIDDYIRFTIDDPDEEHLPHLIIIVDEFAELKQDRPDFMRELISASRVGRSLGLHLVLATQKPSNSVSDEIWANSNFRICLRVQNRSDSMEMLHRPEAAYIKNRGRCYIQIGNDEIFEQIQTSYSGMAYQPDAPTPAEMPHLLNNAGQVVAMPKAKLHNNLRQRTQMDEVLDRIGKIAQAHHCEKTKLLWADEMPESIFLRDIAEDAAPEHVWGGPNTGEELKAVFAMGDDVQQQRQFPVWMDLMAARNYMVVGMASTGKTTMMQTLILSFAMRYSPAALQIYVMSLTSRTLGCLAELPHIGEIVYAEETDELRRLLHLLEEEDQRRRKLFAEASTDSFQEYNRSRAMAGEQPVPAVIVFADRFAQAAELLGADDADYLVLQRLVREANARGIYFVVSAMRVNEIPYRIRDCFKGIGLQVNDRMDYVEIVGKRMPSGMPDIAAFPGRGLVQLQEQLYEIQTALAGSGSSDVERAAEISAICSRMNERWTGIRPKRISRVPQDPTLADFAATEAYQSMLHDPWQFAFAYNGATGLPELIHLETCHSLLITGAAQAGKTNLLQLIAHIWSRKHAAICVAADASWAEVCSEVQAQRFDSFDSKEWEHYVSWLNGEIRRRNQVRKAAQDISQAALDEAVRALEPVVLLIDDLDTFISKNPEVVKKLFADIANRAKKYGIYLYAAISHNAYPKMRMQEPLASLAAQQHGVALGGALNACDPWGLQIPYAQKKAILPLGEAYMIGEGTVQRVIVPKDQKG